MATIDLTDLIAELKGTVRVQPPAPCALVPGRAADLLPGTAGSFNKRPFEIFESQPARDAPTKSGVA